MFAICCHTIRRHQILHAGPLRFPAQYLHVSYRLYTPQQSAPLYSVSSSNFYPYPAFVQRAHLLPSLRSPVIYQRGAEHLMARNAMITVGLVMKRWQRGSRFVLNSFPLIFFLHPSLKSGIIQICCAEITPLLPPSAIHAALITAARVDP